MKRQRLSPQSWIETGLSELISDGPTALAAEPLARKLGTTKGSFYWHFKDVPDFQHAVVKHWQTKAFALVLQALETQGNPEQRLRRFGRDIIADKSDAAMRAWSRTDTDVAKAVQQVDAERLKYLSHLMKQLGIGNNDFARSSLAALVGLPGIASKTQAIKAYDALIDLLLALK